MMKSRKILWQMHVARMREIRNAYNILVEGTKWKRPLVRPRRRLAPWRN